MQDGPCFRSDRVFLALAGRQVRYTGAARGCIPATRPGSRETLQVSQRLWHVGDAARCLCAFWSSSSLGLCRPWIVRLLCWLRQSDPLVLIALRSSKNHSLLSLLMPSRVLVTEKGDGASYSMLVGDVFRPGTPSNSGVALTSLS